MVTHHTETDAEQPPSRSRRSYLKLAGAVLAAGGLGGPAVATPAAGATGSTVNLADSGLTEGDTIDSYLEDAFEDGVTVTIPAGTYEWEGLGFHEGATSDAAVIGEGEVVLELTGDAFRNNLRAESGTIELRNFTVRGKPTEKSHFRLETAPEATIIVDNVNWPDGAESETKCRPYYVPRDHEGTVDIRNCYYSSFSDNGIYASSPGYEGEGGGRVIVENCVSHNNNIAGIRIGSSDSVVRNCLVINDGPSPESEQGERNMRGIRVRAAGEDILIENCTIINKYEESGAPIQLHEEAAGGSGTIKNVTIVNNADAESIDEGDDAAAEWDTSGVEIAGEGDLSYPETFESISVDEDQPVPVENVETRIDEILASKIDPSIR